MSGMTEANTYWASDHVNDMQVRVHTTRQGKGKGAYYRVWACVYVLTDEGWKPVDLFGLGETFQVGTINKDTNLPTSQEWVTHRVDLGSVAKSDGFHPTLSVARARMAGMVLTAARRTRKEA